MVDEKVVPAVLIERLRYNLLQAGLKVPEEDIQGAVQKGFFRNLINFEKMTQRVQPDLVPDFLDAWGGDDPLVAASATATAADAPMPPAERPPSLSRLNGPNGTHLVSVEEVGRSLQKRDISPVELTEAVLSRIAVRDQTINAFQMVLPERALEAARQAEQEIATGRYLGPLHGVPIAVKDLLAMRNTLTTAGSKVLDSNITDFDADAVERLEAAGAIIVGKTRMSEFAYSPASNNSHFGATRNPWNLERDSGGSSSGSAAAVAGGMVYAALGTDTGGSIRMPAALCGLVGLKPTFGRTSLYGGVPLAWSLDHLGPLTSTVTDAALLLEAVAGYDARDPRTRPGPVPPFSHPGFLEAGVRDLRIGVLGDDGSGGPLAEADVLAGWHGGLAALESAGARLVGVDLPEMQDLRVLNSAIIALEALTYHHSLLVARRRDYGEFMRQRVLVAYAYDQRAYLRAQQARLALRRRFNALFDEIDLLSTPAMPYGAPPLGDPARNLTFTAPFNLLGWPAITVPVGLTQEALPAGLQLAGRPWDELTVLRAARALEAAL